MPRFHAVFEIKEVISNPAGFLHLTQNLSKLTFVHAPESLFVFLCRLAYVTALSPKHN